jgi:hypothetical protein
MAPMREREPGLVMGPLLERATTLGRHDPNYFARHEGTGQRTERFPFHYV